MCPHVNLHFQARRNVSSSSQRLAQPQLYTSMPSTTVKSDQKVSKNILHLCTEFWKLIKLASTRHIHASKCQKDHAVSPTQKLSVALQRHISENMESSPGLNGHISGFIHSLLRTDRAMDLSAEIHICKNLDELGFPKLIPKILLAKQVLWLPVGLSQRDHSPNMSLYSPVPGNNSPQHLALPQIFHEWFSAFLLTPC